MDEHSSRFGKYQSQQNPNQALEQGVGSSKTSLELVQPSKISSMTAGDRKSPSELPVSAVKLHNQKVAENLISILVLLVIVSTFPIFFWQQITATRQEQQKLNQANKSVISAKKEVENLQTQLQQSFGIGRDQEDNIRKSGAHKPNEIPIKSPVKP